MQEHDCLPARPALGVSSADVIVARVDKSQTLAAVADTAECPRNCSHAAHDRCSSTSKQNVYLRTVLSQGAGVPNV